MSDGYRRDGEPEVDPSADPPVDPEIDPDGADTGDAAAATGTPAGTGTPAHRPGVDAGTDRTGADGSDRRGGQLAGAHPRAVDRQFDWRGWTLVVAILVSFLVIPGIIVLYPHVGPSLGLTFWDTYLALPLIPAVVLALLAVWATTRP